MGRARSTGSAPAGRVRRERPSRRLTSRPRPQAGPDAPSSPSFAARLARRLCRAPAFGLLLACLALALAGLPAVPAQAQTELWSEGSLSLNAGLGLNGCDNATVNGKCSDHLDDDEFTYGTTDYAFTKLIFSASGRLDVEWDPALPATVEDLTITVEDTGGNTAELDFADADHKSDGRRYWDGITGITWHNSLSYTLVQKASTASVPGAPGDLRARTGDGQVTLSWDPPSDTGGSAVTGYQHRHAAGTSVPAATSWTDAGDVTEVTVTGLTNDTEYAFEVRAVNGEGEGAAAAVTATPAVPAGPAPPACPADADWCTEMTAFYSSALTGPSTVEQFGFIASSGNGALSDDDFNHAGTDYTVTQIFVSKTTIGGSTSTHTLSLAVSGGTLPDGTVLSLNGTQFTVGTDTDTATVGREQWEHPTHSNLPSWVQNQKVTVGLKFPAVAATDATLSALALEDGSGSAVTLTPTFASDTYAYTASVATAVSEVTVRPTKGDAKATIEWLDGSDAVLHDPDIFEDGFQVDLAVGATAFKVKVTAEDGMTTETYTVTVTRAAPPAPSDCPTDADWCATLSVGDFVLGDKGYVNSEGSTAVTMDVGALSDDDFTYAGTTYKVWQLFLNTAANPTLRVRFDPPGETVFGRAGTVLTVGGEEFDFGDATFSTTFERFEWTNSGLSWSDGDTVTVSLKLPPASTDATLSALELEDRSGNAVTLDPGLRRGDDRLHRLGRERGVAGDGDADQGRRGRRHRVARRERRGARRRGHRRGRLPGRPRRGRDRVQAQGDGPGRHRDRDLHGDGDARGAGAGGARQQRRGRLQLHSHS